MNPTCLLSELIEEYCAALQKEKPADEGTRKRYRDTLDTMLQLLGDREVSCYSKQDLVVLKAKLYRWPANIHKLEELRGKTAAEILRQKPAKTLDKRTVDSKYMDKITAVFQYAFRHNLIAVDVGQNVVKSVTVAEKKAGRRKPYDIEDLKKIFAALPVHPERPHLAWVPLIAAYSGARHGEICSLKIGDVHLNHRIPYLLVTEEDDNGVVVTNIRGEVSRRIVPLHPLLLEMGLLQFVARRKALGKELLFDLRKKGDAESIPLTGDYYGQSFESYNRKHVTNDLRKSFYSFRFTLHKALQLKGVSPELCFAITGHLPQYDSEQVTAEDPRLADKFNALVQLDYPGLELAGLKARLDSLLTPS